ncbi:MAG: methyltransferase [Pseudomonadota bacterium]
MYLLAHLSRLTFAIESGALALPETGEIGVVGAGARYDLGSLPSDRLTLVSRWKPDVDAFLVSGYRVESGILSGTRLLIVVLPRAKVAARDMLATAAETGAEIWIDGEKTSGVDSIYRDLKARADVGLPIAKAHGKIFSLAPGQDLSDWRSPPQHVSGYRTAAGTFSADGPDPGSVLLVEALPHKLGRHVADLGASWGYLSAQLLERSAQLELLDVVEADGVALDCARSNVDDDRARFHWADATDWRPDVACDAVVMNPPFHNGAAGSPELGRRFIENASRILTPRGDLWMVANRHLPYEATLSDAFQNVRELPGDPRYKLFHASGPRHRSA